MPSTLVSPWSLLGTVAAQRRGGIAARLDLARPEQGIAVAGHDVEADHLLGLDVGTADAAVLTDHWLRGRDVTGVYEPADARLLRATAMWRSLDDHDGIVAWEVVVSAQTSLLETEAAVAVISTVAASDLLWAADEGPWRTVGNDTAFPRAATRVLARRGGGSVLVAVHPADARGIAVERDGTRPRIACRLFASAVEKGVLLRSRVLAASGPAAGNEAWAMRVAADFATSPPPLTT